MQQQNVRTALKIADSFYVRGRGRVRAEGPRRLFGEDVDHPGDPLAGRRELAGRRRRQEACIQGGSFPWGWVGEKGSPVSEVRVDQLLELPSLRGRCEVVAGRRGLNRQVKWVHVSELLDIARLLNGGEFLLTTGMLLARAEPERQRSFALELAERGAAGLGVELVQWMTELPRPLVEACDAVDLPLVAIREEVRFSTITEEAARLLLYRQYSLLRDIEEVTSAMMARLAEGADPEAVLGEAERRLGRPVAVVLKDGKTLASSANWPPEALVRELVKATLEALDRQGRPRGLCLPVLEQSDIQRDGAGNEVGRLVGAPVHVLGRCRGVVWLPAGPEPEPAASIMADRVAMCVATALLHRRQRQTLLQDTGDDAVELLLAPHAHESLVRQRLRAMGADPAEWTTVAVLRVGPRWPAPRTRPRSAGRLRVAEAATPGRREAPPDSQPEACVRWLERALIPEQSAGRTGPAGGVRLLAVSSRVDSVRLIVTAQDRRALNASLRQLLGELAEQAELRFGPGIGVFAGFGRPRNCISELYACYREAMAVCEHQARGQAHWSSCSFEDLSLGRLLGSVDPGMLRAFVEQELGPLLKLPERRQEVLLTTLQGLVEANFNVALAARRLPLRRQNVYRRLQQLDDVLPGFRADSPDRRAALVVALRAWQFLGVGGPAVTGGAFGDDLTRAGQLSAGSSPSVGSEPSCAREGLVRPPYRVLRRCEP